MTKENYEKAKELEKEIGHLQNVKDRLRGENGFYPYLCELRNHTGNSLTAAECLPYVQARLKACHEAICHDVALHLNAARCELEYILAEK